MITVETVKVAIGPKKLAELKTALVESWDIAEQDGSIHLKVERNQEVSIRQLQNESFTILLKLLTEKLVRGMGMATGLQVHSIELFARPYEEGHAYPEGSEEGREWACSGLTRLVGEFSGKFKGKTVQCSVWPRHIGRTFYQYGYTDTNKVFG